MDGDTLPDMVLAGGGYLHVYRGGIDTAGALYQGSVRSYPDFDGDGKKEVVWAYAGGQHAYSYPRFSAVVVTGTQIRNAGAALRLCPNPARSILHYILPGNAKALP